MSQQASLIKLKEQIEAAKRNLSEMPVLAITNADASANAMGANFGLDTNSRLDSVFINDQPNNIPKTPDVTVVDLEATKKVDTNGRDMAVNKDKTDHLCSSNANPDFEGFQFFRRQNQLEDNPVAEINKLPISDGDTGAAEDCFLRALDRRLTAIEIDTAQNRLHIDELIRLSSRIVPPKAFAPTPKSMRRLVRRYLFWIVIGFLAIGWFALTPSGHIGLNYLLSLK